MGKYTLDEFSAQQTREIRKKLNDLYNMSVRAFHLI